MTALVADGYPIVRSLVAEALKSHFPSLEVVQASSAAAASRAMKRRAPALAVIDLDLPGDGFSLLENLRDRAPCCTIGVWLSEGPAFPDVTQGRGANHVLRRDKDGLEEVLSLATEAIRRTECAPEGGAAP
jgi:DNA-binding NarL/FixJ family response regulator